MKKIILIISILAFNILSSQVVKLGTTTINRGAKGDMPSFTINGTTVTDGSDITVSGGIESYSQIFIPTLASDFTSPNPDNANKIWAIYYDIDLSGGDFSPPPNITLLFVGANIFNIGSFTPNNTSYNFTGLEKFDLFNATVNTGVSKGTFFQATNFGAIDDGLTTTDNQNVGRNLLDIVNSASATLYWNKKDTGIYYTNTSYKAYLNLPFFPSINPDCWVVGNGNDNVKVIHNGDVEIRKIPDDTKESQVYIFHNTNNSSIEGGTIKGDRYDHLYNQTISVTTAATSAGNFSFSIDEYYPFQDQTIENTVSGSIPLTLSNLATNITEIVNFINTDVAFADYTAVDNLNNTITVSGQPGTYFRLQNDGGTSGITLTANHDSYEWSYGISYGSNSNGCIVKNMKIWDFHGDGLIGVYQGNGTNPILTADMSDGYISDAGVIDADTNFKHLTTLRNLPTETNNFTLSANANASTDLKWFRYKLALYDNANNFLETTNWLEPYEVYTKRDTWVKYRLIVDYNGAAFSNFYYFLNSGAWGKGAIIDNVDIGYCRRQGISNPPIGFSLTNSKIHDIGGALPEWGIDLEDNHKFQIYWNIDKNEFWNCRGGGIIVKGALQGSITKNKFKQSSWKMNNTIIGTAISTAYGRDIIIDGNFLNYQGMSVDIGVVATNNRITNGFIEIGQGNSIVSNNILTNTRITDKETSFGSTYVTEGIGGFAPSTFKDNIINFNQDWGNNRFIDEYSSIIFENNKWYFNNGTFQHGNTGITYPVSFAQSSTNNIVTNIRTIPNANNVGYHKNTYITGLTPSDGSAYSVGLGFYAANHEGLETSMSVQIDKGFPQNFIIDGLNDKIKGWFKLKLDQFANTGADFHDVTLKNLNVEVPVESVFSTVGAVTNVGWLRNRPQGTTEWTTVFYTAIKDVNVYVKDSKFVSLGNETGYFLYAGQRGVLEFDTCQFISKAATLETINLTDVARVPATTGAITFIDPTFENVAVTLRSIDKVVFTKASPLMATYATFADDAAAATEGYPSGYMYMTATGEFRIKL